MWSGKLELKWISSKYTFVFSEVVTDSFRCKQYIIPLRNTEVEQSLRETYSSYAEETQLSIFCVSNTMYWKNRQAMEQNAQPSLELSGIPALRRYCIGIVAESHLSETVQYIKDTVPVFIGSMELWLHAGAGATSMRGKEQIMVAVDAIQSQMDEVYRTARL